MARLPKTATPLLNAGQQQLYAAMTGGPRGGGNQPFRLVDETGALTGPFNTMLLQPAVGQALQALGAALRYQGSLPDRARELTTLVGYYATLALQLRVFRVAPPL